MALILNWRQAKAVCCGSSYAYAATPLSSLREMTVMLCATGLVNRATVVHEPYISYDERELKTG